MHAAALIVLTTGLWALGALPEHITALLFFALAMVLSIAPPHVVFSGFASATMWLVLGGLFVAEAVRVTGLGGRFAAVLFGRFTTSYVSLIIAIAVAGTVLALFMPATVGRGLELRYSTSRASVWDLPVADVATADRLDQQSKVDGQPRLVVEDPRLLRRASRHFPL